MVEEKKEEETIGIVAAVTPKYRAVCKYISHSNISTFCVYSQPVETCGS